jgi:hypothetical protein
MTRMLGGLEVGVSHDLFGGERGGRYVADRFAVTQAAIDVIEHAFELIDEL